MDFFRRGQPRASPAMPEPAARRISTRQGDRLSTIVEGQDFALRSQPMSPMSPRSGQFLEVLSEEGDNSQAEKLRSVQAVREHKQIAKRGGWKRLVLIAVFFVIGILGLVLGLVFGLRMSRENNKTTNNDSSLVPTQPGTSAPPAPTAFDASGRPENFPVGSYMMATFLDTVQTDCTSNADTWRCAPYTTYNDNKQASMATFNWAISADGDGYKISSLNANIVTFEDQKLELLGKGTDDERYSFRTQVDKMVSPSGDISGKNQAAVCDYNLTTFRAYLWTKKQKNYPSNETSGSDAMWPYQVTIEQTIAGGQNVPSCYEVNNGQKGAAITEGLEPQGSTTLCSCLYRNWLTPN